MTLAHSSRVSGQFLQTEVRGAEVIEKEMGRKWQMTQILNLGVDV